MITISDLIKDVNNSNRYAVPKTGVYLIGNTNWIVCKDFPTGKTSPAMVLNRGLHWTHSNDILDFLKEQFNLALYKTLLTLTTEALPLYYPKAQKY